MFKNFLCGWERGGRNDARQSLELNRLLYGSFCEQQTKKLDRCANM